MFLWIMTLKVKLILIIEYKLLLLVENHLFIEKHLVMDYIKLIMKIKTQFMTDKVELILLVLTQKM